MGPSEYVHSVTKAAKRTGAGEARGRWPSGRLSGTSLSQTRRIGGLPSARDGANCATADTPGRARPGLRQGRSQRRQGRETDRRRRGLGPVAEATSCSHCCRSCETAGRLTGLGRQRAIST